MISAISKSASSSLRALPTYPVVHGDPLRLLYDLMNALNMPEEEISRYGEPRGYTRIAKVRRVNASARANAILNPEGRPDEEGDGE